MAAKHSYGSYAPELATDFIAGFEGLSLSAYACPAGKLTIGYGHTTGVVEGQTCTPEEASQWLIEDQAVPRHREGERRGSAGSRQASTGRVRAFP